MRVYVFVFAIFDPLIYFTAAISEQKYEGGEKTISIKRLKNDLLTFHHHLIFLVFWGIFG